MNSKELLKQNIVRACAEGKLTVKAAAAKIKMSGRHVKYLKKKYRESGGTSFLHGNCGRQPKRTYEPELKQRILEIKAMEQFETVNFLHFREILTEIYKIPVSYSFLRKLLLTAGITSPKKHRKAKKHCRRKRRSCAGELLQTDASPFQFFKGDKEYYSLHGAIDDATGDITGLYMSKNECMEGYFEVMRQTFESKGVPVSLYADGSSIFFYNKPQKQTIDEQLSGISDTQTQFSAIMDELGIDLIHARSSQAKGRIERLWNTLQSRLVVEFAHYGIDNPEKANIFLKKYIVRFNKKFGNAPADVKSAFIPLSESVDLDLLLCVKYSRVLDNGISFSLNNVKFVVNSDKAKPKMRITVLINRKMGVRALCGNTVCAVTPISHQNREITSSDSAAATIDKFVYYHCLKNERTA